MNIMRDRDIQTAGICSRYAHWLLLQYCIHIECSCILFLRLAVLDISFSNCFCLLNLKLIITLFK